MVSPIVKFENNTHLFFLPVRGLGLSVLHPKLCVCLFFTVNYFEHIQMREYKFSCTIT